MEQLHSRHVDRNVAAQYATFAYVGCNSRKEEGARKTGRGNGISVYRIDPATRDWSLIQVCEALPNPGFLALDRGQKSLYAAHGDYTEVSAFAIEPESGKLRFLNKQPTGGHNSRHVTVDPSNRYVVLNHGTGISVYPRNTDGSLAASSDRATPESLTGAPNVNAKSPCPHQVVFDPSGQFILVPDRNLDRIHIYRFDSSSGKLLGNDPASVATDKNAGPRHIAFHPTKAIAYLVNETNSTVSAYSWNPSGDLQHVQTVSSLPTSFTGRNSGSEIAVAPSGKFVFASNRGHDTIAVLAVDEFSGALQLINCHSTLGKKPRFFSLDARGDVLYVANQDTDTVVFLRFNDKTGGFTPLSDPINTGSPVCIVFAY